MPPQQATTTHQRQIRTVHRLYCLCGDATNSSPLKKPEAVVTVDVVAAKDLLGQGRRYLDVRTNEEFNKGHIDSALNVPYMFITQEGRVKNPEFLTQVSSICQKEDQLIVGCNSGGRSLRACVDLLNAGFKHVTNMGGGYSAWIDNEHGGNKSADEFKTFLQVSPLNFASFLFPSKYASV